MRSDRKRSSCSSNKFWCCLQEKHGEGGELGSAAALGKNKEEKLGEIEGGGED